MVSKHPKISVVMPFYNAEKFLDQSIQSILNQTFTDFEFIIINDASTDNSNNVVQKYLYDARIVYIKNEINSGIANNVNNALRFAKSEYIARLDGDDYAAVDRLEKEYEFLIKNKNVSVVGTNAIVIDEENQEIGRIHYLTNPKDIKEKCFYYGPLLFGTSMFRKKHISAVGAFRQKYSLIDDIDILYRLIYSGYDVANIPEYLSYYRKHSLSTNHMNRYKAFLLFKLRREIIMNLHPKMDMVSYLVMYLGGFIDIVFPKKIAQIIAKLMKYTIKLE